MNIIPRTCGIYCITCTNGKIYIGSSINIERRWQHHLAALNRGDHRNHYLQRSWNKYGDGAFFWEVVHTCDEVALVSLEQFYLELYQPFNERGFNLSLDTKSNMRGRKHKPESILKMSVNRSGHITTDEHRAKLSKAGKGRPHSDEHKAKIGAAHRGRVLSPEHRAKISKNTHISEAQKEASRAVQSKHYIVTTPDGIEIQVTNLQKFCRENGLHQSAMCEIANGKRPHYKKWLCRHV